jgi:hypothetical protein
LIGRPAWRASREARLKAADSAAPAKIRLSIAEKAPKGKAKMSRAKGMRQRPALGSERAFAERLGRDYEIMKY